MSGIELELADILGTGDDIVDFAARLPGRRRRGPDVSVLVFAVGSSDADANQALVDLAERLATQRDAPVRAAFGTCDPRPERSSPI